jgi:hypothetical protein
LRVPKTASGMAAWRKSLFAMMHLNANLPAAYFGVPPYGARRSMFGLC